MAHLILQNGTAFEGRSIGFSASVTGEVVFTTGMVGYPESLTDPSYRGQILVFTYPMIGNYGVSPPEFWESERIQVAGIIVAQSIKSPSHWTSQQTLVDWLKSEHIPALELPNTRQITHLIRDQGSILGEINNQKSKFKIEGPETFIDPNKRNLVAEVSVKAPMLLGTGKKKVLLIDCGAKRNIERLLVGYGCTVLKVPWNYSLLNLGSPMSGRSAAGSRMTKNIDGVVISNGPGDPKLADQTIKTIREVMHRNLPILGICLGNQILTLAAGGDTRKLKFGHRGQNQPCRLVGTKRCFLTTQNHGFEVHKVPRGFVPWFINANDGSNEGIRHKTKPWRSVQFHPEACPGPTDTEWVIKEWVEEL